MRLCLNNNTREIPAKSPQKCCGSFIFPLRGKKSPANDGTLFFSPQIRGNPELPQQNVYKLRYVRIA